MLHEEAPISAEPGMNHPTQSLSVPILPESVTREPSPPRSKADFARALRILSRKTTSGDCRFEAGNPRITAVQGTFLRCPFDTWLELFGQPESTHEHHESVPLFPVHVWKYQSTDGPVHCVGFQVDDLYGTRWVTFVRVCYF